MSTLKSDYPIKINSTDLFRPEKWSVSRGVVENTFQTEDGKDNVIIVRTGKVTIDAEFACTASWASTFEGWNTSNSLTVKYYDPATSGYIEKTMRMRDFKMDLNVYSDRTSKTLGAYMVSFKLIEF